MKVFKKDEINDKKVSVSDTGANLVRLLFSSDIFHFTLGSFLRPIYLQTRHVLHAIQRCVLIATKTNTVPGPM